MFKRSDIMWVIFVILAFFSMPLNADVIHLAPGDFSPSDPDEGDWKIQIGYQDYIYAETGATDRYLFSRCLDLPHLGTFDQIRIHYLDDSSATLYVKLVRQKISDSSKTILAEFQSSGTASFVRSEDLETFTYPTIKSKGYRYFLVIYWDSGVGSDLCLFGIRVRFYHPSS